MTQFFTLFNLNQQISKWIFYIHNIVFCDFNADANKMEVLQEADLHSRLMKLFESKSHNKVHIQPIVKSAVLLLYRISETEVGRQGILAKYEVVRSVSFPPFL